MIRTIAVRFGGSSLQSRGQEYHYLVPEGDAPVVGDIVVTSLSGASSSLDDLFYPVSMKAAFVTEVHSTQSEKASKFYLKLISREETKAQRERNASLKKRVAEQRRIRAELERRLLEQTDRERFAALAAADPEAARLLEELDKL